MLEEGERVEADKGYRHSAPEHIRYPGWLEPPERAAMTQRVRCRHETVNKRMKQWNILRGQHTVMICLNTNKYLVLFLLLLSFRLRMGSLYFK